MTYTEWTTPKIYSVRDNKELEELAADVNAREVKDPVDYIANDLFEMTHPDKLEDTKTRSHFVDEVVGEGPSFGQWVYFDWSGDLIRYPNSGVHYDLRTFRNRNLITSREQGILREQRVAVFGLSVGSKAVDEALASGIGNDYMLFDFDRLAPTNLNRIRASMKDVGLLKTTVAGRKMAEVDPYVAQTHYPTGYDHSTDDILRANPPDVIVEEVDDLMVKARIRRIAKELGVRLIMAGDVADKNTLDIERHDLGDDKPFNRMLSQADMQRLLSGEMDDSEREGLLIKLLGVRNLSPRLLESAMLRGVELAGFPQLGTTSTNAGVLVTLAMREAALGRNKKSSRSVANPMDAINARRPTSLSEDLSILKRFIRYRKDKAKE